MRKALYMLVVTIGLLQIIGYVTKIKIIRDIGVVSASSPLPIVFTEVRGVETFASDFFMKWTNDKGEAEEIKITPELYSRLKGPYNRRNVYGAAISYGPVLPEKLWKPVLSYGLCNDILRDELDIPVTKDNFSVLIKTRTKGRKDKWSLKVDCVN